MKRQPRCTDTACDNSGHLARGCTASQGTACCDSCETQALPFWDQLLDRHPWLDRLFSNRVRFVTGLALFILALFLEEGPLKLALYVTGYLIVGTGVIIQAFLSMVRGKFFSEHFLMSVATLGAFVIGEYAEAFAVMLLYLVGEELEDRAVDRTRRSIDTLKAIRPLIAHLDTGSGVEEKTPASLQPGQRILVYPGERIPLDGRLESSEGSVDYSALTGESRPVTLVTGDEVMAGAINGPSALTLTVLRDEAHSAVMRIMDLAEEAGQKKTPIEMFTDRFSRIYTPLVVFLALAMALLPPLFFPGQAYRVWVYRALNFLVISCPCALVISVPLAFIAGIGNASRRGIYIRGSQYLEALTQLETVVFDKTGTLTTGSFEIVDLEAAPGVEEGHLLRLAAAMEGQSTHPLALAVMRRSQAEDKPSGPPLEIQSLQEIAGHGLQGQIEGRQILAGNQKLMDRYGIEVPALKRDLASASLIHLAEEGRWIGSLIAADALRPGSLVAIDRLRDQGTQTIAILSGDRQAAVSEIGMALGADYMASGLLPAEKIEELEKLSDLTQGRTAFVGDGINDAPVLRLADVGIAIGGLGSDAAVEAADMVIMTDELERLPDAVAIARMTKRRVTENLVMILLVKGLLMTLGALGITPLWGAVFADTGVMLLAVLNSLRAYYGRV